VKRALLCLFLVGLGVGCGKDDPVKPRPPITTLPIYPSPSQPESVLIRYQLAWELRDSVMIDTVIAADYTGTSIDLTDSYPTTIPFSKSDEVRIVGAMKLDPLMRQVSVDLYPPLWTREAIFSDPPEWVTIRIPDLRVEISTGLDEILATGQYDCTFTFRPITPAPNSPTDTTWAIVRWKERKVSL